MSRQHGPPEFDFELSHWVAVKHQATNESSHLPKTGAYDPPVEYDVSVQMVTDVQPQTKNSELHT